MSYAKYITEDAVQDVLLHKNLLVSAKDTDHQPAFSIQYMRHDVSLEQNDLLLPVYEVIFCSVNQPRILGQLLQLLYEINLNIRVAHVFSTIDGYTLEIFEVDGWHLENTEGLQNEMENAIARNKAWKPKSSAAPNPSSLIELCDVKVPSSLIELCDVKVIDVVERVRSKRKRGKKAEVVLVVKRFGGWFRFYNMEYLLRTLTCSGGREGDERWQILSSNFIGWMLMKKVGGLHLEFWKVTDGKRIKLPLIPHELTHIMQGGEIDVGSFIGMPEGAHCQTILLSCCSMGIVVLSNVSCDTVWNLKILDYPFFGVIRGITLHNESLFIVHWQMGRLIKFTSESYRVLEIEEWRYGDHEPDACFFVGEEFGLILVTCMAGANGGVRAYLVDGLRLDGSINKMDEVCFDIWMRGSILFGINGGTGTVVSGRSAGSGEIYVAGPGFLIVDDRYIECGHFTFHPFKFQKVRMCERTPLRPEGCFCTSAWIIQ